MNYSKTGMALTKEFEGCKLEAYPDSTGVPTIGYGHTAGVRIGDTCTYVQANAWLENDILWAVKTVNYLVHVTLTQGEFDACVDFVFNLGSGNFQNSTLLKLLNRGDMISAENEFDRWDRAGGKEVPGLLRRRQAEAKEFLS